MAAPRWTPWQSGRPHPTTTEPERPGAAVVRDSAYRAQYRRASRLRTLRERSMVCGVDLLTSRDVERLRDFVQARHLGESGRLLLDVLRPQLRQASDNLPVRAARRAYHEVADSQ